MSVPTWSITVGPDEEPVLVTVDHVAATVDGDAGALGLAGADQAEDPLLSLAGHDRPHLAVGVAAGADLDRAGPLVDRRDDPVAGVPDGHASRCASRPAPRSFRPAQAFPSPYCLIVTVTGGVGQNVVVCDRLPDHMTYVSVGSATLRGGEACWDVGDLSGSRTLAFTARVDKGTGPGTLVNRATATSSNAGHAKAHAGVAVPARHAVQGAVRGQVVKSAGVTG